MRSPTPRPLWIEATLNRPERHGRRMQRAPAAVGTHRNPPESHTIINVDQRSLNPGTERGTSGENRAPRATQKSHSPRSACRTWPNGLAEALLHFSIFQEAGLELSTIYAKWLYERHKMVYTSDPSRAFYTAVNALLLLLGCRGFIIPPPVRTSVNQGLRRPLLLQSPTTLRSPLDDPLGAHAVTPTRVQVHHISTVVRPHYRPTG